MIRSKLIKWLKWGMVCCMLVPFLAWQAKDTSFQPTDTKGFIAEMQKQFAEVQTIKKKENHRENKDGKQKYEMRGKYDVSDDCAGYGWHVAE